MWGTVIATGAVALAAGALAVPTGRRLVLGSVQFDWLANELELDRIEADGATVRLKSGELFRVHRIAGVSYDAKVDQAQLNLLKVREAAFLALGELGLGVRLFGVKRRRDLSFDAAWPSPTLAEIGEAEKRRYASSFVIDWFVVLSGRELRKILEGEARIAAILSDYQPRLVRREADPDQGCPLTGFLNHLVSGDLRRDLPSASDAISANLPASDIAMDRASGVIRTMVPAPALHRVIAIRLWPEAVGGTLIGDLFGLAGDIEIAQICKPISAATVMATIGRKEREYSAKWLGNPILAEEFQAVRLLIMEGKAALFTTQFQVTLRADSTDALDELTREVGEVLGRARVAYSVETAGAALAWFNRMPGRDQLLRPLKLLDGNIAALWAWQSSAAGMQKSPFGDRPVRMFSTPAGQSYAFQFHVADKPQSRGNFLVFAPTGGGKSTLMMHLLGGLAQFQGVRSYIFDSKEGARFMVEAMGGRYQGYEELALNPLDVGPDSQTARNQVYAILKAMVQGVEFDDEVEADLAHAVDLTFQLTPPERTLDSIFEFAFRKRSALRRAMSIWVTDNKGSRGLHAHLMNAPHDSLGSVLGSTFMLGINMNEALDDPILGPPVVAHIASAISKSAARNSRGFVIFIDEAAKLLENDGFRSLAKEMYREYRKLNGAVGLAFQDPGALHRSGIADAVIENTATFIFLPNSEANPESLKRFNLNDEQVSFVMGGGIRRKQGERRVLVVKRDAASGYDESAIIDVDLSPLGDALRLYRAGTDANAHLAAIQQQWGAEWLAHI